MNTKLRSAVGNPTTTEIADTDLTTLNNESIEHIQNRYTFLKARRVVTFPTVADESLYEIPSDCVPVLSRLYAGNCRFVVVTSRNDHDFVYAKEFVRENFKGVIRYSHNTQNQSKADLVKRLRCQRRPSSLGSCLSRPNWIVAGSAARRRRGPSGGRPCCAAMVEPW